MMTDQDMAQFFKDQRALNAVLPLILGWFPAEPPLDLCQKVKAVIAAVRAADAKAAQT